MKYKFRRHPKSYVAMEAARLTPRFAEQCGLTTTPTVCFSRPMARDMAKRYYKRLRSFQSYGVSYYKANLIWLNPNMDMEETRNTLAHEFVHFRFPYLSHGCKFNSYIKWLLAGGSFTPYRPRKKAVVNATVTV